MPRCQFGLCGRDAELEVTLCADVDAVLVCGLHIGPLLSWGVPDPHEIPPIIHFLPHDQAS